jgi:hypothetical protein
MKPFTVFLLTLMVAMTASAQFRVSENKRFLLKDNKPFFWLGDTAWELFHKLNAVDAEYYLRKRSEQGFTVVQAVVLAELDGLHKPNANGDLPLINDDPTKPNEAYFRHIDFIIEKAASYNLSIALLPTWGDKVFANTWGKGPEIFNVSNAKIYAAWLAKRYTDRKNIIWILGGDRNPRGDLDLEIWRAMGEGIMEATNNKAIISFHPQPNDLGSARWFHKDPWLAFNMFQTGHCRDAAVYNRIQAAYTLQPAKPVLDAEPIYEDHPVCFNVKDLGTSNAFDVRRSAYLDVFAGAFGHTYGCHDVWQMFVPGSEAVNGPHMSWKEALELPGAGQMIHLRRLMETFSYTDRVPDQSLILENNNASAERIQATRGQNFLMVYSSAGKRFTIDPGKVSGNNKKAYWYDPRSGAKTSLPMNTNSGSQLFTPPSSGYGKDWVLVVHNDHND